MTISTLLALSLAIQAAPAATAPADETAVTNYHNEQALYLYSLKYSDGWGGTASGIRYRRIKGDGTGPKPTPTDTVTIHYTGKFTDGRVFDSSVERGQPATFPLPRLIEGWQEGVPLMSVGDTFEFAIPWQLAYGPVGRGEIPGGATLLFTIELIDIPQQ